VVTSSNLITLIYLIKIKHKIILDCTSFKGKELLLKSKLLSWDGFLALKTSIFKDSEYCFSFFSSGNQAILFIYLLHADINFFPLGFRKPTHYYIDPLNSILKWKVTMLVANLLATQVNTSKIQHWSLPFTKYFFKKSLFTFFIWTGHHLTCR